MLLQLIFASLIGTIGVLSTVLLIPFTFFGYRLRHYSDSTLVTKIEKNIVKNALIISNNVDPQNFSYGKWFIAYVGATTNQYGSSSYVYVFCNEKTKNKLLESLEVEDKVVKDDRIINMSKIIVSSASPYGGYYYIENYSKFKRIEPNDNQKIILDSIMNHYNDDDNLLHRTTVYLDGESGSGKSSIAYLLYLRMISENKSVSIAENYQPLLCNNMFKRVLDARKKSNKEHLIVTIEEVDGILNILTNTPYDYKFPKEVYDKSTWDSFLDRIDNCEEKIILILTSNTLLENFKDESYLRQGRTHLRFRLNKNSLSFNN